MHATNSRLESLIDLQESALKHDDRYQEWLIPAVFRTHPGLQKRSRSPMDGRQQLMLLLGSRLAGLGVGSIENTIADETALPASNLFFIESGPISKIGDDSKTLSSKVRSSRYDLQSVLAGAYIAETLPEAMQRRTTLKPHECVVTRCGTVVGKNWVRAPRRPDNETGLLSREDEIDGLRAEVSRLVPATQALEDELLTVRERFRFLEQQKQTEQQEVHGLRLTGMNTASLWQIRKHGLLRLKPDDISLPAKWKNLSPSLVKLERGSMMPVGILLWRKMRQVRLIVIGKPC
ncbi:MAG: hypothetical protein Ct9H300mP14_11690 [Gammaproteobacteria bacterium]|nr:MAG: hypothetical protein Ct9H300mP14_11690 [Gammaproteobacteria bacterium]